MTNSTGSRRRHRLRLGLITGAAVAVLVVVIWSLNLFVNARLRLANLYYVQQPTSGNVIIVAIDERSIQEYGAYQDWSRERYADLLATLTESGARVVGFDLLFSELREGDDALEAAIVDAEAAGTSVVLAAAGVNRLSADENILSYQGALRSLPQFTEPAAFTGFINTLPDADGTVRHYPSLIEVDGEQEFSFPLAAYFSFFNMSATLAPQAIQQERDRLTLPGRSAVELVLDENGLWLMNYFGAPSNSPDGTFPVYSISDVLGENVPAETFADKIVLVGLVETVGAVDQRVTPLSINGQLMAGVEINANALETLLSGVPLRYEPRLSQMLTIVLLSMVLSVLFAQVRWYGMVMMAIVALFIWLVYASVIFSLRGLVLNPLHPNLTIFIVLLASIGVRISDEIRRRQDVETILKTLVQVSEQQTEFDRVLTLLSDDLRLLTGATEGAVWIPDAKGEFVPARTWGVNGEYPNISLRASQEATTQVEEAVVAVPVVWQGKVSAVMTVNLPPVRARREGTRREVERFAGRVAANLENARLFSETRSQNQILQGVLAESPAGILVLDDALNIQRYNERVADWLEMQNTDFAGQPMSALLENSPMDRDTWQKIGRNLMKTEHFRQEVTVHKRTLQLDAAHIPGGQRWVLTLSDISELAELSNLKTRMIRIASHDLKNPLGRIVGYAELMQEMLEDGEDDLKEYQYFVTRMIRSGDDMNKIITEILDLEHIRSGRLQRDPLDMVNTIKDVLERNRYDAEQKKQTLNEHLPESLPIIMGDFNQIVQALSNIIGNAIKYTPEGGQIDVRLFQHDDAIRLEVQDNGYGMPKEAQANLFTEFYRVHTEHTKDIKGSGLGLSLVKAVIQAHEGKIWVESEYEVGSTFFVELPITPPE